MSDTKYWRLRLKGELSTEQVQAALPENAMLLRIHRERAETHVYFSTAQQHGLPNVGSRTGEGAEEVSLDLVTNIA